MHSSPFIIDALLKMIELGEVCALEYLAKSLKVVNHCFNDKTQKRMLSSTVATYGGVEYGVIEAPLWCKESEIKTEIF